MENRSYRRIFSASLLLFIGLTMLAQPGTAATSMIGLTGLVDVPTARLIPDGRASFGAGYTHKDYSLYSSEYAQVIYYVTVGYLPFLETSFRVTVFPGMPFSGDYGSDKDRMVSLKLRVMHESRYLPSIVLGGHDIYGETTRFNTLYVVMSRHIRLPVISDLDIHLGYASDLMDAQYHSMSGVFGGLEMRLSRSFAFMWEYNTRRHNAGLRITPWGSRANVDLVALGLRGLSGGVSFSLNL